MMRLLSLIVVWSAAYAGAQTPPPAEPPQQPRPPAIRTGTNVVRVDVTVLDKRGEPVTDIKAEEFEIEEDGVEQPLQSFQLVKASGFPDSTDEHSLPIRSPEHARAEAAREDVRVFLIFWDEYHLHPFASSITARQALHDFVLSAFGPRDLVALMDPLLPTDAIRFTRDRRALADAIHKLTGRRGVYVPARSVMEEELLRRPRDIERVRYEVSMTALKAAAVYLGTLREGRKSIVFVSEGARRAGAGSPLPREVIRAANQYNTAIYTLDPRGLGPRPSHMLIDLARSTGGEAFVNTNAPARLLPQVVKHASAYYLLGYSALNSPADGKFHRIRVRVKRPGVEIRARSGYWAPTVGELTRARDAASAAGGGPLQPEARAAIYAGSARRSIDLWVGSARGPNGLTEVTLAWSPHDNGRVATAQATGLEVTATGSDGREYFQEKLQKGTVSFQAPPGLLQLKLAVWDADGAILERDLRKISVPNFAVNQLAVSSPVLLRARTAIELKTLLADPDAPPFIGREFRRSERLLVRFEVYGSHAGAAKVSARLMTRAGGTLVALPVTAMPARPGRYQIDLPLSATARGEFMIAIEAGAAGEQVQSIVPLRIAS
jgi:VWFA-related protein